MAGTKGNGKIHHKGKSNKNNAEQSSEKQAEEANSLPDLSLLRKSIQTSVTGFAQAKNVFDNGTEELKNLLSNECDVIYECRVCRNLFRSLANFISHKRIYCRDKFTKSVHAHFIDSKFLKDDMAKILQNELDYQAYLKRKGNDVSCTIDDTDVVKKKKKARGSKDLTAIIEKLTQQKSGSDLDSDKKIPEMNIKFQSIEHTNCAVYQNIFSNKNTSEKKSSSDFIREQVSELEDMLSSNEAVLGPDGKILNNDIAENKHISPPDSPEEELDPKVPITCDICNLTFSTQKTYKFHKKTKHADDPLVYPCPDCSDTFTNVWSVYRHLYKVHRKNTAYIRKLRDSIQKKAYRKDPLAQEMGIPSENTLISEQLRLDQENQAWMDNFEGDCEMPRCGGCGRKFERRAALISHRHTCQLRIAAQNKINSNLQQRHTIVKSNNKSSPLNAEESLATAQSTPITQTMPKIYPKPCEKKIEIKIRRDYNKGPSVPNSCSTESLASINSDLSFQKPIQDVECSDVHTNIDVIPKPNVDIKTEEIAEDVKMSDVEPSCAIVKVKIEVPDSIQNDDNNKEINSLCNEDKQFDLKNMNNSEGCANNQSDHVEPLFINNVVLKEESPCVINSSKASTVKSEGEAENTKQLLEKMICQDCNLNFSSNLLYRKHMARHFDWKRFKCKLCNFRSYNRSQCLVHIRNQHESSIASQDIESLIEPLPPSQTRSKLTYVSEFKNSKENQSKTSVNETTTSDENSESKPNLILKLKVVKDKKQFHLKNAKSSQNKKIKVLKNKIEKLSSKSHAMKKNGRNSTKISCFEIVSNNNFEAKDVVEDNIEKQPEPISEDIIDTNQNSNSEEIKSVVEEQCSTIIESQQTNELSNQTSPSSEKQIVFFKKMKKRTPSTSQSSIERPIRNRVKLVNKDFEYDLSSLLKPKGESHEKEPSSSPSSSCKNFKRNARTLETDSSSSTRESPIASPEKVTLEKLKISVNQKLSVHNELISAKQMIRSPGFLSAMSSRASLQGKAHMRTIMQTTTIKRKHSKRPFRIKRKKIHAAKKTQVSEIKTSPVKVRLIRHQFPSETEFSKSSIEDIVKPPSPTNNVDSHDSEKKINILRKRRHSNAKSPKGSEEEHVSLDSYSEFKDFDISNLNNSTDSNSSSDNDFKFFISGNQKTYSKMSDQNLSNDTNKLRLFINPQIEAFEESSLPVIPTEEVPDDHTKDTEMFPIEQKSSDV